MSTRYTKEELEEYFFEALAMFRDQSDVREEDSHKKEQKGKR